MYISQRENEDPAPVPRQSAAGDTSWEGWPGTVNENEERERETRSGKRGSGNAIGQQGLADGNDR